MSAFPQNSSFEGSTLETAMASEVAKRRESEAWMTSAALGSAAFLSVLRATLVPLMFSQVPEEKMAQFASFVSPEVQLTHWLLAGVYIACFCFARRNPLYASLAAIGIFLLWAIPDVLSNPVLVGGGHLGKLVTAGILGRAAFGGVMHYILRFERAPESV